MKRLDTTPKNMRGPHKKLHEDIDVCPVCGKARGRGIVFVDHGACAEKQAAESAKKEKRRVQRSGHYDESRISHILKHL